MNQEDVDTTQQIHDGLHARYVYSGAVCSYEEWLEFHLQLADENIDILKKSIRLLEVRVAVSEMRRRRIE